MAKAPAVKTEHDAAAEPKSTCGIIMPIAAMLPKYEASHWVDVRRVIDAAIEQAGMVPQIVSDSFEGDVIQRRIISNLYENPVVVCDVSGLNPNVMFELGMRITFKQPVVIITDDYASIPFDTKVIEHIGYPRDLHIHQTNEFIKKLSDRIQRLHEQKKDETFRSFIEEFGTFEVLEPTKKVVESDQFILDEMKELSRAVRSLTEKRGYTWHPTASMTSTHQTVGSVLEIALQPGASQDIAKAISRMLLHNFPLVSNDVRKNNRGNYLVRVDVGSTSLEARKDFTQNLTALLSREVANSIAEMTWVT